MMEIPLNQSTTPFNLEHTLNCGQLFRWKKLRGWWYGVVDGKVIKVKQIRDKMFFQTFPERVEPNFLENYFRLNDNLPKILSRINKDEHVGKAIQRFRGLRIIRQEPWECLISYICATNTNIPAIKNMILNLSKRFGRKIIFEDQDFYAFPKPSDLADVDIKQVKMCKLGFRAERVLKTSRIIHNKEFDLETLKKLDYKEAKNQLLPLPGVGQKVADCVLLFSLDKLEAFPVDVWMKRVILEFYPKSFEESFVEKLSRRHTLTSSEYQTVSSFGRTYFGEYAGYAQEYLFALAREGRA
ncbi:MAG: DNA-3-methyladenine glycosylase family protein [Candidatus Bathyarchaeia archaeon]